MPFLLDDLSPVEEHITSSKEEPFSLSPAIERTLTKTVVSLQSRLGMPGIGIGKYNNLFRK